MKFLAFIENTIVMIAMAGMACITFANVLSRYFFDTSFAFAEEITINLFVLATFVGASIAIRRQSHFGFHYFFTKFNPSIQRFLVILTSLLMLFFLSLTLFFGMELVFNQMERGRVTPALNIPQWIFTGAIPLGSLLCMIRTVEMMVIRLKRDQKLPLPKTDADSKELKM
ncbi:MULTISPECIES: TRAP transporter small permease [Shouchella]|uniref:TRAP transporter small permease n=2 Tax=Shouchella TaxID=2893057 RepID=A0ABY7W730_9BACI|nr:MULTISPECIES: TRAP transporter small permease [Shouchella]MED4130496.1 TRAP transporter small permease [Shouchella miscanthi]WDF03434.1 TRAP transporter small permease [Shouchella hunanensis]GAF23806.1 TRAP-type transport system, small permease component, predicted N-acetylneuraminate transporter [Bacillus sp. JCM 19047]